MKKLVTIFILGFSMSTVARATVERDVTLEIEPIEGAQSYDVEIKRIVSGEVQSSQVTKNEWNGKLPIGRYEMRNRSIDQRGIPGSWSKIDAFEVGLEKVVVSEPKAKASISAATDGNAKVHFQWQFVEGATQYSFEIKNEKGDFSVQQNTTDNAFDQELSAGQKFKWKVVATGPEDLTSEAEGELEVMGSPVEMPIIQTPIDSRTPQIVWSGATDAQTFEIKVERYQPKQKRWENLFTTKTPSREGISLNHQFPDGAYRVRLTAQADLRQSSPEAVVNFRIRRSIMPTGAWYARASIAVDSDHYVASKNDGVPQLAADSDSVGQTLRLELGRMKGTERWGVSISAEMSNFKAGSETLSASAAAVSLLRRDKLGFGELVSSLSVGYKTLPNFGEDVSAIGPGLGLRYNHRFSPIFGMHFGARVEDSVVSIKTPNGQSIDSSFSYAAELLLSYRWNRSLVGYFGLRHRDDQLRFPTASGTGPNMTSLQSDSLNLIFEYDF